MLNGFICLNFENQDSVFTVYLTFVLVNITPLLISTYSCKNISMEYFCIHSGYFNTNMPRDTLISVNKVGNESFLMVTKVFVLFQSSNCLAEKEGELVALR